MQLVNDLIELLSDQNASLTGALLKTNVLLFKIGHKELTEWVKFELYGYPEGHQVPGYRRVKGRLLGRISNIGGTYPSHPLPLGHLPREVVDILETSPIGWSIAALESMLAQKTDKKKFAAPLPLEFNADLGQTLTNGYVIEKAWLEIEVASIEQILINVRARLLDFVLNLQNEIGATTTDDEMTKKAQSIDAPTLFTNSFGNYTTVIIGNHNSPYITITVTKGDFAQLENQLKQHHVEDGDIAELKDAIDCDKDAPVAGNKKFGPSVEGWFKKMMGKAVDTSWQIEIAIGANLLTNALQKYYGL
ncbi:hypothetical protein ACO0LO_20645 [Undibacterium sp. TJN25]|uniref:AbiTii domain-containing protein n=1 Tax=Undibacterium sp. TJN25 TaxID=3413056 RepID=UPI003BF164EC